VKQLTPQARARLEAELGAVFIVWLDGEAAAARARGDRERLGELEAFVGELAAGTGPVRVSLDGHRQQEH
jgi:hypothetical protein